jgi:hypothetical protein
MLRRRRWQLRRIKLDVVHVLALRRVELHVSLTALQEAQDFHILRFHPPRWRGINLAVI